MNKYLLIFLLFLFGSSYSQDSLNMSLISNVTLPEIGNDIWGYVDQGGTEYAIMGSESNVWIWSLEDPTHPIERARISGDASTWRDIKSWEDHIYVTADSGNDGLLIIDMSGAPDVIQHKYISPDIFIKEKIEYIIDTSGVSIDSITVQDTIRLGPCHNLTIDEKGFCYLAGCRINGARKAIIFDLNQDKWTPPIVGLHGLAGADYAHDLFVKNDIMYASEINIGKLAIYDVSQKDTLKLLGSTSTSFNFTHNAWPSNDQNFVFTTDERPNAYVDAFDVSDLTNIVKLDSYRPLETEGAGVIPHNTHYYDGFLVTSYYTDGVIIIDATNPSNLIKVGSYDTYTASGTGFKGCWGAYPYLPSGLVLASDINTGLYVLNPEYTRAAFLEGIVTDAQTGSPINGVAVTIESTQKNASTTNALGEYKTGIATSGTYRVTFYNYKYEELVQEVTIENGEITILNVEMNPLIEYSYTGHVTDKSTGLPIENAIINFASSDREDIFKTDNLGYFEASLIDQKYDLYIGKWGHKLHAQSINSGTGNINLDVELESGYEDDFVIDLGWETFSSAISGDWERGVPIGTYATGINIAPGVDDPFDFGEKCYVTGNGGGEARDDDVDEGVVVLATPQIRIKDYTAPVLRYKYWFANVSGEGEINDTLFVNICNDTICHRVASYYGNQNQWSDLVEIPILDYTGTETDLRVEFITSDIKLPESSGHIVEAAIDAFSIVEGNSTSNNHISNEETFIVFPNPFDNKLTITNSDKDLHSYSVFDIMGKLIIQGKLSGNLTNITLNLNPGVYTLKVNDIDGQSVIKKIIKK